MSLSHENISSKFVEAGVFDFSAMGRLIAELGPELAVNDRGWHGINIGKYNILACMLPAADLTRVVGDLGAASLTAKVLQASTDAAQQ